MLEHVRHLRLTQAEYSFPNIGTILCCGWTPEVVLPAQVRIRLTCWTGVYQGRGMAKLPRKAKFSSGTGKLEVVDLVPRVCNRTLGSIQLPSYGHMMRHQQSGPNLACDKKASPTSGGYWGSLWSCT